MHLFTIFTFFSFIFEEYLFRPFAHFNWFAFIIEFKEFFIASVYRSLISYLICNYLPLCRCLSHFLVV